MFVLLFASWANISEGNEIGTKIKNTFSRPSLKLRKDTHFQSHSSPTYPKALSQVHQEKRLSSSPDQEHSPIVHSVLPTSSFPSSTRKKNHQYPFGRTNKQQPTSTNSFISPSPNPPNTPPPPPLTLVNPIPPALPDPEPPAE